MSTLHRYYTFNRYLKRRYGTRVYKISIDAGFGCPHRKNGRGLGGCIFCEGKGNARFANPVLKNISSIAHCNDNVFIKNLRYLKAHIKELKKHLIQKRKAKKFILYFQSFTNTYAPLNRLKEIYSLGIEDKDIVALSIGTRPDKLNKDTIHLIQKLNKKKELIIELGLQTVNDYSLKFLNRRHTFSDFNKAYRSIKNAGIKCCVHIIIGIPGETREDHLNTASYLGKIQPDFLKIHSLYIPHGTGLERYFFKHPFYQMNEKEYSLRLTEIIEILSPSTVIQRITAEPYPNEDYIGIILNKIRVRKNINKNLVFRNSYQGFKQKKLD